ncbi:hypothetical protein ACFU8T_21255 [Sphingobacterium spiritivorum]|nr:hypothetical protein [Sphingobacterium spiritivorum]QQT34531.1 hypothetical protein I6J01_14595 [Sphingobacterium spiritivorum]WQD35400.1 hypothetical protein U0038_06530 [Sphingobacterium spiritivorum]SUJ00307.1 Uncharacterised protein [Sphingobacterium spiritivorum]
MTKVSEQVVRVTIYRNPNTVEVLQRDDYYPPAGGLQKSPNPVYGNNKYSYQPVVDKCWKREAGRARWPTGLRRQMTPVRLLADDPVIGRWNVVDKFNEVYRETSPYGYALGNPIKFIDKDGNFIVDQYGRIIATPKIENGRIKHEEMNGALYAVFTIKTNQGTDVEAWRLIGQGTSKYPVEDGQTLDMSSNCYGFVLTGGEFYLPIYDKAKDEYQATLFLEQILAEEGISVNYNTEETAYSAKFNFLSDGFLEKLNGDRSYAHIFKRNFSMWEGDHGYYGVYRGWNFDMAATKDGRDLENRSFIPYQDKRPQKQYNGISVDLSTLKGMSSSDFWSEINRLINNYLK